MARKADVVIIGQVTDTNETDYAWKTAEYKQFVVRKAEIEVVEPLKNANKGKRLTLFFGAERSPITPENSVFFRGPNLLSLTKGNGLYLMFLKKGEVLGFPADTYTAFSEPPNPIYSVFGLWHWSPELALLKTHRNADAQTINRLELGWGPSDAKKRVRDIEFYREMVRQWDLLLGLVETDGKLSTEGLNKLRAFLEGR